MWAALVRDRGGLPLDEIPRDAVDVGSAAFACALVEDEGPLPLVARLSHDPLVLMLKAGRVGGGEGDAGSLPITEADAAAALAAALDPATEWERDPDFGFETIVSPVAGVDENLLLPRFLYRRADRVYEYAAAVPEVAKRF
jgi:hypothetical protein